ncbi:hypothetical protein KM043_005642 [Ampulex compressa]|nr:hypothetical protein KM043_005642 [Ampulex compressa]
MAHGSPYGMASRDIVLCFFLVALLYSIFGQTMPMPALEPEFLAPLENHTVIQGHDVSFTCVINHLQRYKMVWIKSSDRALLALLTNKIVDNPRMSFTHNGHNTWKLHVTNVQLNDSGTYMCQLNTYPMRSLTGYMKVLVPPDILDGDASSDLLTTREHKTLCLRCRATGTPTPTVVWRREDGRDIPGSGFHFVDVKTYEREELCLFDILRQHMGSYLCVASNGVPPAISKRYFVNVHFKPLIEVSKQVVKARANSDVVLQCYIESSPKALNVWYRDDGVKILPDEKYVISEAAVKDYAYQQNLTIRRLDKSDFGNYTCSAENAFGKANETIRLLELHLSTTTAMSVRKTERGDRYSKKKNGNKKGKIHSDVISREGLITRSNANTTPMSRENGSNVLACNPLSLDFDENGEVVKHTAQIHAENRASRHITFVSIEITIFLMGFLPWN